MTDILTATGLTVRFGHFTALENLTLFVASGEKLALLGHNGAGKSTFIRTLLGFLEPAEGEARIAGHRPGSTEARAAISYLPENVAFQKSLTGVEILRHFACLRGAPPSVVTELLEKVGIAHAARRPVGTWSKGMRQRLALAQALIGTPPLMLLDEPTSGLDPVSRRDFYALIDEVASAGTSVLLSSHGLEEIEHQIDRVAILSSGKLVAEGTLAALAERAALKAKIRVTAIPGEADRLSERLGGTRVNGASVELSCSVPEKFALVRRLAAEATVSDVDVRIPGLNDVYRYYSDLGARK